MATYPHDPAEFLHSNPARVNLFDGNNYPGIYLGAYGEEFDTEGMQHNIIVTNVTLTESRWVNGQGLQVTGGLLSAAINLTIRSMQDTGTGHSLLQCSEQ